MPALLNALTLAGTLSLGLHLAGDHGLAAAAVVLAGATLVTLTSRDLEQSAGNLALRATAVAYSVGLIVLAGWVGEGRTSAQANYAVGFAAFFLDGLVLGMIREQFANVIRSDVAGIDAAGRKTEEVGLGTVIQVFTFGLAALASLATLFAIAAPQLGLDVGSGFPDVDFARLGVALGLALALTAAARLTAKHVDSERKEKGEGRRGRFLEHRQATTHARRTGAGRWYRHRARRDRPRDLARRPALECRWRRAEHESPPQRLERA